MKLYRTIWNVHDTTGALVPPGGAAKLSDMDAAALIARGAVEAEPIGGASAPTEQERLAAILALVPKLAVGDFTQAGQLRAEARRRIAGDIGFEPTDEEIRAAGEAYAKVQAGNA